MQIPVAELQSLERVYRAFDTVSDEFSHQLGVSLCIPNCGKCCEVVLAHRIEAAYSIRFSRQQGMLDEVVSCAEGWLLERHSQAPSYDGPRSGVAESHITEQFWALGKLPCPFLLTDKTCLIYSGRPMVCRAYGVTRTTGPSFDFCPRPLGKGETATHKAWADAPELKNNVEAFVDSLTGTDWKMVGRLPTAIFEEICPDKYKAYIADNKIASAKLVGLPRLYPGLLWQLQMHSQAAETRELKLGIGK